MDKTIVSLVLASFLMLAMMLKPLGGSAWATEAAIRVPQDYPTIQEAVNQAQEGDTIYVYAGTYHENIIVNKSSLTLMGENMRTTILDGGGEGNVVEIRADNVTVIGFTVRNGQTGIQMSPWSQGHSIGGNIVVNNDFGIRGHFDVHDVKIFDNIITESAFCGIELALYNSVIKGNNITDNGKGSSRQLSAGIEIVEGIFDMIVSSNNNTIAENIIEDNYNGVWAVRYSRGNVFSHNTFANNTNHLLIPDPSLMWNNSLRGNFWSDYSGEDSDGNGIGDTPYIVDAHNRDDSPLMSPFAYWNNPGVGDINRDMKVDVKDLTLVAWSFGSYIEHPEWNANVDVTGHIYLVPDGKIDIRDMVVVAKNFGWNIN